MAAFDAFLKIKGIEGESKDSKLPGHIELQSFSWGSTNGGSSSHGTGGGAGKVSLQDFHFTMTMNKASAKLFSACAKGEHISDAKLIVRKAGGEQQNFLEVEFFDILVSSYQTGGGSGGDVLPTEQISLNFTKVQMQYFSQDEKGKMKPEGKLGWDVKLNKAV